MREYALTILQRCNELALISQHQDYIDRRYLTNEHRASNEKVALWMRQANMKTWQDEAGNLWGSYKSSIPNAPTFVLGSHLDTVPNSGKYDGILGVLLPLSLIEYYQQHNIELPFNLDVVGFADEEGTRFGTTLLGSRAVAGTWQDKWASLRDSDGIELAQAMRMFGLDINRVHNASRGNEQLLGFMEVHIEQGPVLESQAMPVGIVSGIAGAKRFAIKVKGHAGHAGTVPMSLRQDAMTGAAEIILAIEKLAIEHGVVATVGQIASRTNAVNVISGEVELSLDIRSMDDVLRETCVTAIEQELNLIVARRALSLEIKLTHEAGATACDPIMMDELALAFEQNHMRAFSLSSGAGHDAMAMVDACPMSMLFVRCDKGISHHPSESVTLQDVNVALQITKSFMDIKSNGLSTAQVA
ncbi:allantoate amidohydrolase [Aliiglaciecola sp. LCG003]|nr:allantoate amidohydrolase [Aliiglaciecola sp. LCG003]WJG11292.1 allantoate amidohydrolase [Aliiglaciecola sp. LCG003]